MLVIRNEQMAAFAEAATQAFAERLVARIRERAPARYAELRVVGARALAAEVIAKGEAYGVDGTTDVEALLDVVLRHGIAFEEREGHESVRSVLEDPALDGSQKMSLLRGQLLR